MSTSAIGKVVDENGKGVPKLGVSLEDTSQISPVSLARGETTDQGQFSLSYADFLPDTSKPGRQVRTLRLRITVGQHVIKQIEQADTTQATIAFPTIAVTADEATSWFATLGTGQPARLSRSSALRWLVDNEDAWSHVQDVIEFAGQHVDADGKPSGKLDVMQLTIDVEKYNHILHKEKPSIVLRFDPAAPLDASHRRSMDDQDVRIERSMLAQVQKGVDLRMQIPKMTLDRHGIVSIGAIAGLATLLILGGLVAILTAAITAGLVGLGAGGALLYIERKYFSNQFGKQKLAKWFADGTADVQSLPPATALGVVRVGELRLRSNIVTHAKVVIDRDVEAVLLGSPFEQWYYDSLHVLDEPRRGRNAAKGPIHDVSVSVRGGPVGHLQQLFNNHWNIAEPSDKLLDPPSIPSGPGALKTGEFQCDVQIARTLDSMFTSGTDGEKGILETYLRAIHFSTRFVYIENQYFNNDAITEALIEAVGRGVKVILLLNPAPDMPLYLGWQQDAIRRIADSLKRKSINPDDRLGVFSAWTHASSASTGQSKPTLVDNYLHTKTALIDNVWATVGSANLDGASLDFLQYARPLLDGEVRNTEANVVVFEGPGTLVSAVDALRRRLWSEHLGFASPAAPELADATGKDWLAFWRQRATAKKNGLMNNLDAVSPIRVLEFPKSPFEESVALRQRHKNHATAVAYLQRLFSPDDQPSDVLVSQFTVLGESGPPNFDFEYPEAAASLAAPAAAPAATVPGVAATIPDDAATT